MPATFSGGQDTSAGKMIESKGTVPIRHPSSKQTTALGLGNDDLTDINKKSSVTNTKKQESQIINADFLAPNMIFDDENAILPTPASSSMRIKEEENQ